MNQGKKYTIICRLVAVAILSMFAVGCTTMARWMKVPSQEYVDERFSQFEGQFGEMTSETGEIRQEINQVQEEVGQIRGSIDEFSATADKLEELLVSFQETMQTTEELSRLAGVLEERLNDLPKETIRQLVDVLQTYLGTN